MPVYAFTNQERTMTNTTILFGIVARYLPFEHHSDVLGVSIRLLEETENVSRGDKVVVVSDVVHNGKEFPVIEVVAVSDVL